MHWFIFSVKVWWYDRCRLKRNPNLPEALEQDIHALMQTVHGPCLDQCTRRMTHGVNLVMAHRQVGDLLEALTQGELMIMEGSPVVSLIQRARREPHLRTLTLAEYLMTAQDVPITPLEAYRGIQQLYEDLLGYMSTVPSTERSYYRRQFTHMFEEVRELLLALIEVSLHAKRKAKSGTGIA